MWINNNSQSRAVFVAPSRLIRATCCKGLACIVTITCRRTNSRRYRYKERNDDGKSRARENI
jgi:hypothetical protein